MTAIGTAAALALAGGMGAARAQAGAGDVDWEAVSQEAITLLRG
jgi:hypothetical protein